MPPAAQALSREDTASVALIFGLMAFIICCVFTALIGARRYRDGGCMGTTTSTPVVKAVGVVRTNNTTRTGGADAAATTSSTSSTIPEVVSVEMGDGALAERL